jgi:diguanylate cyclase (GGDEF)-like protein
MQIPFAIYQFVNQRVATIVLSDGFLKVFGYEDRARAYHDMEHNMYRNTHPDDVARIADAAIRFANEDGHYDVIYRSRTDDDAEYHIIHAMGKHVNTDTGVRLAQVWYTDEGSYSEANGVHGNGLICSLTNALHEESLLRAYQYDHLTGLPSMTYFFQLAEAGKEVIREQGGEAVFLFFDLDGMKLFNARYGFSEGDKLLRSFAEILVRTFSNENCCHIGADHFGVFTEEEGLVDILNQLFADCRHMNGGNTLPIRTGIYLTSMEDVPISTAFDRAKFACDGLRNTYGSGFNYYRKSLGEDVVRRQYILDNLDKAIEEKWLQVFYQPIVRAVNGRVCDEEALARWIDPVMGFLSPAEFIPFLEESKQIYKMDLYVLEQVLEKIRIIKDAGLYVVPQSINLSRSDFDACDIVEEIRRRVDDAGVGRDKITIEITESIIGRDFNFIRKQIGRIRALGFQVWMDDFGSGYSSLDVLQSVKFDLIKFDMSFMKRLDEGENAKVILTELMKMATSLGVDTVCEGVETEEQVRFLQEIGCSKLQGYYFLKPTPLDKVLERYEKGIQIGFENPEESAYYDTMGRVNLYDLSFLAVTDDHILKNTFDTVPMGIMEVNSTRDRVQYVRSNQSYRVFMKRAFGFDISNPDIEYPVPTQGPGSDFMKAIDQCRYNGNRTFVNDNLSDGSIAHSFVRRIGENPINGKLSVAIAVLSITEPNEGTTYANIAKALAADYYNLYYVDMETGRYIEYGSNIGGDQLVVEKRGEDFFGASLEAALPHFYEEDREKVRECCTKEKVLEALNKYGVFSLAYHIVEDGKPIEVHMKGMRMHNDDNHIILGVSGAAHKEY